MQVNRARFPAARPCAFPEGEMGPQRTGPEAGESIEAVIERRRTTLPKRLHLPGPDATELARIVGAAAAAPDHGQLLPWRFVVVPASARSALACAFEASLLARDPLASSEQREQARAKAFRSPTLLLAVARLADEHPEIPAAERLVSAGCAIQNMLLMATALGYGSAITSGKAMSEAPLRSLFRLEDSEQALCFVSIGTSACNGPGKPRPDPERYFSALEVRPDGTSACVRELTQSIPR